MTRIGLFILLILGVLGSGQQSAQASWFKSEPPRPGKTTLKSPLVSLPAQVVNHYFIISAKWDNHGPYNFLIDTASSITLVTPSMAQRFGSKPKNQTTTPQNQRGGTVAVRSSEGDLTSLEQVVLRRVDLDEVVFENVPAVVYDCNAISVHLGIRIDGILGFPLFRELLLTVDYPHHRLLLSSASGAVSLQPGEVVPFNNDQRTPIIPLRYQEKNFFALIDTGSDSTLRFNPVGFDNDYAVSPRPGAVAASLSGDHVQTVARLGSNIQIGSQVLERPVVELTDELSALGGAALSEFILTFDQEHNRVTFFHEKRGPVAFASQRSSGMSFAKAGAYWRVAGVIPESPAAKAGISEGDLVVRINQEPVDQWGTERFSALVNHNDEISFAFLVGQREYEMRLKVMQLVP